MQFVRLSDGTIINLTMLVKIGRKGALKSDHYEIVLLNYPSNIIIGVDEEDFHNIIIAIEKTGGLL